MSKADGIKEAREMVVEMRKSMQRAGELLKSSREASIPIACQIRILVQLENDLWGLWRDAAGPDAEYYNERTEGENGK